MTRLILIRHGETKWNRQKRYLGHADISLDAMGQRQANALAEHLMAEPLRAVVSSDLQRAEATAVAIARLHAMPVTLEPRLRELRFGAWEGCTYAELSQRDPDRLAAWVADPYQAPPGGEGLGEFEERISAAWQALCTREGTTAVVAHGGPIRLLLCLALGLPATAHWQFRIDPGATAVLAVYDVGVIVEHINLTPQPLR